MKLVIIESPYKGDVTFNIEYAKECMFDSIQRDECPFASHLLYTQILNDNSKLERAIGLQLGFKVMSKADLVAVYIDNEISEGMKLGIKEAERLGLRIEYRKIKE